MEENWFIRNQRHQQYQHHVSRLDRIYSQEHLRKKIEANCTNLSKIFSHRKQTHDKERLESISKIKELNKQQDEKVQAKLDFYTEQVLRPQIGLSPRADKKIEVLHPAAYQRKLERSRIGLENLKMAERLQFTDSVLSKEKIQKELEKLNPYKELRAARSRHQPAAFSIVSDKDKLEMQRRDSEPSKAVTSSGSEAKLVDAKKRRTKGFTFKTAVNLSQLGFNLSKSAMQTMLDSLAAKKPKLHVPPPNVSRISKSNTSQSLMFGKHGSNILATEIDCSGASALLQTEDTVNEQPQTLESTTMKKKQVAIRPEYLMNPREVKDIKDEFALLAGTLFPPVQANRQYLQFTFSAEQTSVPTQFPTSPRKVQILAQPLTERRMTVGNRQPSLLLGDGLPTLQSNRKSVMEDHQAGTNKPNTPSSLSLQNASTPSLLVRIEGKTPDTCISPSGQLILPWSDLASGPILELVFTDTGRHKTERVIYDITKRHSQMSLREIPGYKLNVDVQLKSTKC